MYKSWKDRVFCIRNDLIFIVVFLVTTGKTHSWDNIKKQQRVGIKTKFIGISEFEIRSYKRRWRTIDIALKLLERFEESVILSPLYSSKASLEAQSWSIVNSHVKIIRLRHGETFDPKKLYHIVSDRFPMITWISSILIPFDTSSRMKQSLNAI